MSQFIGEKAIVKKVCENCLHAFENYDIGEYTNEHYLQCRRFPPQVYNAGDGYMDMSYPYVRLDDFCGEFYNKDAVCFTPLGEY